MRVVKKDLADQVEGAMVIANINEVMQESMRELRSNLPVRSVTVDGVDARGQFLTVHARVLLEEPAESIVIELEPDAPAR